MADDEGKGQYVRIKFLLDMSVVSVTAKLRANLFVSPRPTC